ncbi:uncharacterized protein LOC118200122 [Stegodyphus dumicola]|uniref:uncharacterized protein LOC118200122 n=1 Tax=Stegodyphus dumicola TaxID=202533 RepID=UPI0015B1064C|nr:uncharacterized protein LOC118200122 [Stegodyphus dumicola]
MTAGIDKQRKASVYSHSYPGNVSTKKQARRLKENRSFSEDIEEFENAAKFCDVHMNVKFSFAIPFWQQMYATKVAEGSYGEIYSFRHVDGSCRVFKCIPVDGQHPLKSTPNITLSSAIPDIVCSA